MKEKAVSVSEIIFRQFQQGTVKKAGSLLTIKNQPNDGIFISDNKMH